uniref:Undecaprenyldiphospho-muramoylpentapeptide beta-N-acetylglucosaminyltransferase n=1 Tax=candidate division WOR-3 bacterium TaxID=2052148 RepID=A0A7V4E3C0_UNCW3
MSFKGNIFINAAITGGHIMPGISIAEELRKLNFNCIFLGKKGGLEENLYKKYNFSYFLLPFYHPFGKGIKETLFFFLSLGYNILKLFYLYWHFNPKALIATGNYSCILPIIIAKIFLKPVYLLEQNTVLGRTVKYFSIFAEKVFLGFPIFNSSCLSQSKFLYTGNPLRREIVEESFKEKEEKYCLILGGSLGAKKLVEMGLTLAEEFPQEYFLIQAGREEAFAKKIIEDKKLKNVKIFNFHPCIQKYFKKTKIVITRCGGITLSEILCFTIPAILIPYPLAKDNHQQKNAEYLNKKTGLYFLKEEKFHHLREVFTLLLKNKELREKIKERMKDLANKESATLIAQYIVKKIKK